MIKRLEYICLLADASSAEDLLGSVFWISILWLSPIHEPSILEMYLHTWWFKHGHHSQNSIPVLPLMRPWLNYVMSLSLGNAVGLLYQPFYRGWVKETGPSRTCLVLVPQPCNPPPWESAAILRRELNFTENEPCVSDVPGAWVDPKPFVSLNRWRSSDWILGPVRNPFPNKLSTSEGVH